LEAAVLLCERGRQEGVEIVAGALPASQGEQMERRIKALETANDERSVPAWYEGLGREKCRPIVRAVRSSVQHPIVPGQLENCKRSRRVGDQGNCWELVRVR
jgi:hypothetical protein